MPSKRSSSGICRTCSTVPNCVSVELSTAAPTGSASYETGRPSSTRCSLHLGFRTLDASTKDRLEIAHVLLGLLEERAQRLCDIGQAKVHRLAEALAVALELALFQFEVSGERTPAVLDVLDEGDPGRRNPIQERNLFGQDLGVLQLLP